MRIFRWAVTAAWALVISSGYGAVVRDQGNFFQKSTINELESLLQEAQRSGNRPVELETLSKINKRANLQAFLAKKASENEGKFYLLAVKEPPLVVLTLPREFKMQTAQRDRIAEDLAKSFTKRDYDRGIKNAAVNLSALIAASKQVPNTVGKLTVSQDEDRRGAFWWWTAAAMLAGLALYPVRRRIDSANLFHHAAQVSTLALAIGLLISQWEIFGDPNALLPRDNFKIHYSFFVYFAEFLRYLNHVPDWVYTAKGGVWIEPLANNYDFLAPYRIAASLVAWGTNLSLALIYKISFLWLGQGVFLTGIYFLAKRLLGNIPWACALTALAILSPITVGILHQEQVLSSVIYLPYLWLCALEIPRQPRLLILLASLLGLSMNQNYPQQILIYFGVAAIAGFIASAEFRKTLNDLFHRLNRGGEKWIVIIAGFAFLVSASPVLLAFAQYRDLLAAPDRLGGAALLPASFEDYRHINLIHFTSVLPRNLVQYFYAKPLPLPDIGPLDDILLFLSPCLLLVILIAPAVRFPHRGYQAAMLFGLVVCAVGIYGPLPRLLFPWFPGIQIFRQWYHFLEMLNPHLLFFAAFVLKAFVHNSDRKGAIASAAILSVLGMSGVFEPAFTLIPVAIVLFQLSPWRNRRITPFALLVWITFAGVQWTQATARDYRGALVRPGFEIESRSGDEFARKLVHENREMLGEILVTPRELGTDPNGVGGLAWEFADQKSVRARPEEVSLSAGRNGLELRPLKIPAGAAHLIVGQFNDGRWRTNIDGESQQTPKGKLVKIPVSPSTKLIELTREGSVWNWLIVLMWLPLLTTVTDLLIELRARQWAVSRRRWADSGVGTSL